MKNMKINKIKILIAIGIIMFIILVILLSSITTVGTGFVGVKTILTKESYMANCYKVGGRE